MDWIQLSFDRPIFLLGLLLLPVVWVIGRRSLASLGAARYWLALGGRSALLILLVLALAEVQLVQISQRIVLGQKSAPRSDLVVSVDRHELRVSHPPRTAASRQFIAEQQGAQ